ncbi:RagB/SusD family nutrient uptake outer membrane protein [Sphingobacterium sp. MYb388]|uniref:RagB/SusD family nutrient uptake outer membrane protein n=1 Tax=Sphingobacterium sp. MYb388 TaxID=2745437 RepID=UPI0030A8C468
MKHILKMIIALMLCVSFYSCNKILEEKSDNKLVVPTTLMDLQSILDNASRNVFSDPGEGEVSSDDYYLTEKDYMSLTSEQYRRMYTWEADYIFEDRSNSWTYSYASVYSANTVLERIQEIQRNSANGNSYDDIKGQAYYLRAKSMLQLAALFLPAFDEQSAQNDLGLPIRQKTDFNIPTTRSSVKETYHVILSDLEQATILLPITPKHVIRSSKPAAFGLLARTYLWMRKYDQAEVAASSCLQYYNILLDYNKISNAPEYPFSQFNGESIIFSVIGMPTNILQPDIARIPDELYSQYKEGDLRKELYFKKNNDGTVHFRGSYSGNLTLFGGVSTNEIILIKSESLARQSKYLEALATLRELMVKRWKVGYVDDPLIEGKIHNADEALAVILKERRKELLMRGLRWMDIKRLNKEGQNISLRRFIGGNEFILKPNDKRYALAIPEDIILLTGIQQNPR